MAVQPSLPFAGLPFEAPRTAQPEPTATPARPLPSAPLSFDAAAPPESSALHGLSGPHGAPNFVRHPRARRYVLRVRTDGTVRVTIPRWGSKRDAQAFVDAQRAWIAEQLAKAAVARARRPRCPVISPERSRALRAQAARELPSRLLELADRFGLNVSRISIRNQRWRWGSCSRQGHICLNWRLVDMPADVRDYVLIHELMHLKQMDHSAKFWALVAAACPAYQEARRWLLEHAHGLLED